MSAAWGGAPSADFCIEWTGAKSNGYGQKWVDGKLWYVHRLVMQRMGHDIDGAMVLHSCDNPACYRYDHLSLGDAATNAAQMLARGRAAIGEASRNAKLTGAIVAAIRRSDASDRSLARRYGVDKKTVALARRGSTWKHIAMPNEAAA